MKNLSKEEVRTGMTDIDPVQTEKPDFGRATYWDDLFMFTTGKEDRAAMQAANHVWKDYVTPLQARIKELEASQKDKMELAFNAGKNADEWDQMCGWIQHYTFNDWFKTHWQPLPSKPEN